MDQSSMKLLAHPMHPGEVLLEIWLNGISAAFAARHAGIPVGELSQLLGGRIPVSRSIARRLETAGWATAGFWLRMQARYDSSTAEGTDLPAIAARR